MAVKIKVPKLTENTDEVTITGWIRKEGDTIGKGDPLVEMTTDKAVFEVESPSAGMVRKILAREKSVVPTGYVVALVGTASEPLPDVTAANARLLEKRGVEKAVNPKKAVPAEAAAPETVAPGAPVRATPAARRLAREKGVDLAAVRADSQAEVVTEEMVRRYRS